MTATLVKPPTREQPLVRIEQEHDSLAMQARSPAEWQRWIDMFCGYIFGVAIRRPSECSGSLIKAAAIVNAAHAQMSGLSLRESLQLAIQIQIEHSYQALIDWLPTIAYRLAVAANARRRFPYDWLAHSRALRLLCATLVAALKCAGGDDV